MNKRFITILILAVILPSLYAGVSPFLYSAEVNWHSYKEARAIKSDKPIFVFAKMRFCSTCAAMEKNVFTDPSLAKLLNEQFIPVKETINFLFSSFEFDDLKDNKGEKLTFRGFPAVMVVTGDNFSLDHGYKSSEQLQVILNKVIANQQ